MVCQTGPCNFATRTWLVLAQKNMCLTFCLWEKCLCFLSTSFGTPHENLHSVGCRHLYSIAPGTHERICSPGDVEKSGNITMKSPLRWFYHDITITIRYNLRRALNPHRNQKDPDDPASGRWSGSKKKEACHGNLWDVTMGFNTQHLSISWGKLHNHNQGRFLICLMNLKCRILWILTYISKVKFEA